METYLEVENLYTAKESFMVVLDSRNATRYNNNSKNSDVYFEFEEPITIPRNAIQSLCSVSSFSSPNSLYIINETNNKLSIKMSGLYLTYFIPVGNYNANSFMTAIRSYTDPDFRITFNTVTNKFILSHLVYNFEIQPDSTIYDVMGFSKNTLYVSTDNSVIFPYQCNFNGLNSLNIHFQNLNTQNIDTYSKTNSSIIQSIPINWGQNQIYFNKNNNYDFAIKQDIIGYIHIQIKDDLENLVDFDSKHWNLTLNFTIVKDINRFNHLNGFHSVLLNGYVDGIN